MRRGDQPFSRYNAKVGWIYLSPHFDDVALSCGGLVWEQTHASLQVEIWTICAGDPPPGGLSSFAQKLHARWNADYNAPAQRKVEDINSCHLLGASYRHFTIPDCIYRRHPQSGEYMYACEEALNGALDAGDSPNIQEIAIEIHRILPSDTTLVCPLALGRHVDHQLTRQAAEQLGQRLWYYADFPYVLRWQNQVEKMKSEGWESQIIPISSEGLAGWQDSISAHHSQISTFWAGEGEMRQAIKDYLQGQGGIRLWQQPGC